MYNTINLLDYVDSTNGLSPDSSKIKAIVALSAPKMDRFKKILRNNKLLEQVVPNL